MFYSSIFQDIINQTVLAYNSDNTSFLALIFCTKFKKRPAIHQVFCEYTMF